MQKIIDALSKLIGDSYHLRELRQQWVSSGGASSKDAFMQMHAQWINNCYQLLSYASLGEFLDQVKRIHSLESPTTMSSEEISRVAGILESARYAVEHGFVSNLRHLLHAEMFDSMLDQAEALSKTGHITPAAVLGRITIERWLRDQAEKVGIQNWETDKASVVNDNLKKVGIFSTPKWRKIQSLLDIGNSAAHGKDNEFSAQDVKTLIDFAKENCI